MRRKRAASDFNAEVEAHIQLEADRLRGQGMPEAEAQAAARRAFGNVVKAQERFFESGRWLWWERLRQDLRYALRMLAKTPGFSAIAILTLGLGIGANTAIFSLIDAVLLRSLPVPHPEELMQVFRLAPNRAGKGNPVFANPLWERVRDQQDIFRDVFAWKGTIFDLAQGGEVQRADGLWVSGGFFPTLQIQPAAGRLLTAADDRPGCPALAVLGYSFWQDRFAGDPGAVGGSISLDQHAFQVIGVSAKGFSGLYAGGKFDVAVPLCATAVFDGNESRLPKWSLWWLDIGGRLKPGFTLEQVNARLAALSPAIVRGTGAPVWLANSRLKALPGASGISTLWTQFETPMYVLIAIVGLVLLIACSNIASLMLARATARNRELAVRQAMGASRWRLIRQLLTECLVLSSAGALLGILVARWGSALLVRCISTAQSHIFLDLTPDLRVLGFTGALAVLTAMLFGLLPSWRGTRVSVSAAMKGSSDFEQRARFRPAKWIVASQVALSLVLLVAAGLLLRSFTRLTTLDLGFDRNNVLLADVDMKTSNIPAGQLPVAYQQIEEGLRALPGVLSVSRSWNTPIGPNTLLEYITAGTRPSWAGENSAHDNFVSPSYFETLHMGLLAGRAFTERDSKTGPNVAIVNETFARQFFPGLDPVGQTFRTGGYQNQPGRLVQIVGVVKDSKYESLREEIPPTSFFPLSQTWYDETREVFELRTTIPPSTLTRTVQDTITGVNKAISLDFHTLSKQVDDALVQDRLLALLSSFFGGLALLLATIGMYGTLSYFVTQRQAEFGVRIALGARPRAILRLVFADVFMVLAGGVAAGVCLALVTTRVLQRMLFGLGPRDSATMIGAAAMLAFVAVMASYFPARRATKVDPLVALRYE